MDAELRREASRLVVRLLETMRGKEVSDFWAWERTPMPFGPPSWEQVVEALHMAIDPAWREAAAKGGGR